MFLQREQKPKAEMIFNAVDVALINTPHIMWFTNLTS